MEYVEKAFRTAVTAVLSRDVTVSVADGTPSKARRVGCLGSGRLCGPETGLEWVVRRDCELDGVKMKYMVRLAW